MTLKDYMNLIQEQVKKINAEDENWEWSCKIGGNWNHIQIKWSYLDYLGEDHNYFILDLSYDKEENDYFLTCRTPHGQYIEGYLLPPNPKKKAAWHDDIEQSIINAIRNIADYAHGSY